MNNESKFWISINAIIGATIVAIVFLSTSYWKDHNKKMIEMIDGGADPIEAVCAMHDDYGIMPVCIALVTHKTKCEKF